MESKFSLTPLALDVFEAIKQAGGHVYLVGGCVRDFLLKRRSKDIDVEVHHLSFAALKYRSWVQHLRWFICLLLKAMNSPYQE